MSYRVVIVPPAKQQLEQYIQYTKEELKNVTAARSIRDDARETKSRLSTLAESLAFCPDPVLAAAGYRKIMFKKHSFFMVYRVEGELVVVEAMYHVLQDYESLFSKKKHLK